MFINFYERYTALARVGEYLGKFRGELTVPPKDLNRRWFTEDGDSTEELSEKIRWIRENLRRIGEVADRIGDYFGIVDVLVMGGQAKAGGSAGDLDLFVWLAKTKRPLFMTSDERNLRLVVTAAINGLEAREIKQMMAQTGKENFIDVFVSTVPPRKMRENDVEEEIYYSSRVDGWIKRNL